MNEIFEKFIINPESCSISELVKIEYFILNDLERILINYIELKDELNHKNNIQDDNFTIKSYFKY